MEMQTTHPALHKCILFAHITHAFAYVNGRLQLLFHEAEIIGAQT